ncbi:MULTISPECIES: hypothetical protein [Corallincola]|uniref:Uncharacterized protein n=3 Tax=Corallincola TaxID=1775176 RepID=A0A368NSG0_9GAMM|nr:MULTISPECIES: hypothetical protein [Corallincola]RCU52409.1 hypothetical protein DU002_00080 [Corallincola holothuriorum]TAA48400.1 hypothetical protein EXY25_04015 [Corallincola spongiicola]TCI01332.1 hypothetical protein EZV61_18250 [Corallincola luteus]
MDHVTNAVELSALEVPDYFPSWLKPLRAFPIVQHLMSSPKLSGQDMATLVASWPWPEPDAEQTSDDSPHFRYRNTDNDEQFLSWLAATDWPQAGECWVWLCQESPLLRCPVSMVMPLLQEVREALHASTDFSLAIVDVDGRYGLIMDTYVGYLPGDDELHEPIVHEVTDWGLSSVE